MSPANSQAGSSRAGPKPRGRQAATPRLPRAGDVWWACLSVDAALEYAAMTDNGGEGGVKLEAGKDPQAPEVLDRRAKPRPCVILFEADGGENLVVAPIASFRKNPMDLLPATSYLRRISYPIPPTIRHGYEHERRKLVRQHAPVSEWLYRSQNGKRWYPQYLLLGALYLVRRDENETHAYLVRPDERKHRVPGNVLDWFRKEALDLTDQARIDALYLTEKKEEYMEKAGLPLVVDEEGVVIKRHFVATLKPPADAVRRETARKLTVDISYLSHQVIHKLNLASFGGLYTPTLFSADIAALKAKLEKAENLELSVSATTSTSSTSAPSWKDDVIAAEEIRRKLAASKLIYATHRLATAIIAGITNTWPRQSIVTSIVNGHCGAVESVEPFTNPSTEASRSDEVLVPTHQLQLRATEEVAQILRAQAERKAEEPVEDAPRTILTYIRVNSKAKSTDDRHFVPRSDNPPRGTAPTRTTSLPLALYSRNAVYSRSPGLPLLVPLSPLPGD